VSANRFFKSPEVLVQRRSNGAGLTLLNRRTGRTETLDTAQARERTHWPVSEWQPPELLLSGGFVLKAEGQDRGLSTNGSSCDDEVPKINRPTVKWYYESPDLGILYNTAPMARANPLLALGPYGTLCWREVEEGNTIGRIRKDAESIFGRDEVLPFLGRLADLRFLRPISGICFPDTNRETITKEFPAPEIQWRLPQSAVPWYCLWEISTTCDLRCRICYLPNFADPGPDSHAAIDVAKQIVDSRIFYVCLLGGEVLLRSDLEGLIERLHAEGVYVKIITNGIKLSPERAKALASAGLNQVEVSFDGLSPEVHESSRGRGTFRAALLALHNTREAGIPRDGIVWTVHQGNLHEMENLPSLLRAHQVRECYISLFKKAGLMGTRSSFQPLEARQVELLRVKATTWKEQYPELSIVLLPGCSCGRTSVVVGSNGDVRLCSFSYVPVGNVFQQPLLDIWRGLGSTLPASGPAGFCTRPAPPARVMECTGS